MANPCSSSSTSSSPSSRWSSWRSSPVFLFNEESASSEIAAAEAGHFLDCCYGCKTPLHMGDDIYMYRGDLPFCTEECRQEQIEIDEDEDKREKMIKIKSSRKIILRSNNNTNSNRSHVRPAGAVVAV